MLLYSLSQSLHIPNSSIVAFVGAGGKTSAMFQVARELAPALVTTSTHLGEWQVALADHHFIWEPDASSPEMEVQLGDGITLVTGTLDAGTQRYCGLMPSQLEKLRQLAGYHDLLLLIEADGARQKALKAPGVYEPAIPAFVNLVVVVAGLNGLYKNLGAAAVHRPQIFGYLSDLKDGDIITPLALAKVLVNINGGLKNIPSNARRIVLLNQADTTELQFHANEIAALLLPVFDAVVVAGCFFKQIILPAGFVVAIKENTPENGVNEYGEQGL